MTAGAFAPRRRALPKALPIFPLPGVLLLPRGRLPLNIFEPRYLNMTRDVLGGDRMIGMIQPCAGADAAESCPPVYPTGCAGRITEFSETEDGRFLLTLTGVARFDVVEELPMVRGYRRVVPDWTRFEGDLKEEKSCGLDRARLVQALRGFFKVHGLSADWDAIDRTPDERLVTSLSMICPFDPSEKQALLEAPNLVERSRVMITLIEMAVLGQSGGDAQPARH